MSIFEERFNYKPFEYPEIEELGSKLTDTFWTHKELTFEGDKIDFYNLNNIEKEIVLRTLTLIATIEVKVKDFWGQLGNHFPKPEIKELGSIASESEVRHTKSYDKLLSVLDMEEYYNKALKNDFILGRFNYLDKYLKLSPHNSDNSKYLLKLILFSVLIENVSLFSQFATIMYFYKHNGIMKDIRNIVKWTSIDEQLHFNIGVLLTNILRKEFPEMFTSDLEEVVHKACLKAIKYESKLLEWVFEKGELQKMSRENLEDYMKFRVNESLDQLGFKKLFENQKSPKELDFFYEEVFADSQDDFFAVRPVDYTLKDIAITGEDLF